MRSLFMWIREGHEEGTKNLSQSASNEQGEDQKKRSSLKFRGIFLPKSKIQTHFPAENRWFPNKKGLYPKNFMKSGVSPQKLQKYGWQTSIWASICTPVAPILLLSSGHSPRLGGTIFIWGGTSTHLGGHGPEMPPVAPGLLQAKPCYDLW